MSGGGGGAAGLRRRTDNGTVEKGDPPLTGTGVSGVPPLPELFGSTSLTCEIMVLSGARPPGAASAAPGAELASGTGRCRDVMAPRASRTGPVPETAVAGLPRNGEKGSMVFKRFLMAFGVGGPSIDTVLRSPHTSPGAFLEGVVELSGGDSHVLIEEIAVCLASTVEVEAGDSEGVAGIEFARFPVAGAFHLAAGERRSIPFRYPVPWQAPVTAAGGGPLPGTGVGLRTDVVVGQAPDKGDLDPVLIHPLPVQDRILEAFARLGFALKHTDLEHGHLVGTAQQFPFFQEIEFHPSPRYAHEIEEVEVSFVADPEGVDVIIEFDRRGGLFTEGQDLYGRFRVAHYDVDRVDWVAQVDAWIAQSLERHRSLFGGYGHGYPGHPGHGYPGHPGHGYPGHGYPEHASPKYQEHGHRGGSGLGGVVAGIAGGLAAGYVAGEIIDEIGDAFEGDDEDEGGWEEDE